MWQKDAEMDKSTRRLVASGNSLTVVLAQYGHTFSIYLLPAFHILRKFFLMCDRGIVANWETKMEDFDVNTIIWRMFMSVTLQAAVHLGKDGPENFTFHQKSAQANIETVI